MGRPKSKEKTQVSGTPDNLKQSVAADFFTWNKKYAEE
jgi:hypothetical protein